MTLLPMCHPMLLGLLRHCAGPVAFWSLSMGFVGGSFSLGQDPVRHIPVVAGSIQLTIPQEMSCYAFGGMSAGAYGAAHCVPIRPPQIMRGAVLEYAGR